MTTNQQTTKDYPTKILSFYKIVEFLSENPRWMATHNGKYYKYDKQLLEIKLDEGTWLPESKPSITAELIRSEFKLIPPKPYQEWTHIEPSNILLMVVNDDFVENIRVNVQSDKYIRLTPLEIKMLTVREILSLKWQVAREVKLDDII